MWDKICHAHARVLCTYSIDQDTGQDQVEHVEHGASPDPCKIMQLNWSRISEVEQTTSVLHNLTTTRL